MSTYFETTFSGLIPCKLRTAFSCALTRAVRVELEITKTTRGYSKGEVIETAVGHYVNQLPPKGYFIRVRRARLEIPT